MNEPKAIAYYGDTGKGGNAFIRITEENQPPSECPAFLYEDGLVRHGNFEHRVRDALVNGRSLRSSSPIQRDDWYWSEAEQRLIEVASLSDEEYLAISMSEAPRVTLRTEIDKEAIARTEELRQTVLAQTRSYKEENPGVVVTTIDPSVIARFNAVSISGGSSRPLTEDTFKRVFAAIWSNGGSL